VKDLGVAIRKARLAVGKTLQEVAVDAGVSTSYVGRVERGSLPTPPSETAIGGMCTALGLDPSPFLEIRKNFYRTGRARPLPTGNAVEVALNDIAALGEQAFLAAKEQSRIGNIDGAMQLAEIALSHLERTRKYGQVARVAHLLASLNLDKVHRFGSTWDAMELRIRALGYYEVAVSAFRRLALPTPNDRTKLIDTIAQSARQFQVLAEDTDESYLPLSLADFEQWAELVAIASLSTSRISLPRDLGQKLRNSLIANASGERRSDAQVLSGLMASQLSKNYADALYLVAEQRNKELLEELRELTPSAENLNLIAMITINLGGVLIDHIRMTSIEYPEEPFTLIEGLAIELRNSMVSSGTIDRSKLSGALQRCHEKLGSWRSSNEEVEQAVWHLHVAKRLAPDDPFKNTSYIHSLISDLKSKWPGIAKVWTWLDRNVSDDEFRSLTYSMEPPKRMPNRHSS
jgi:transcriptional regulator with XRE-family HTH domain